MESAAESCREFIHSRCVSIRPPRSPKTQSIRRGGGGVRAFDLCENGIDRSRWIFRAVHGGFRAAVDNGGRYDFPTTRRNKLKSQRGGERRDVPAR